MNPQGTIFALLGRLSFIGLHAFVFVNFVTFLGGKPKVVEWLPAGILAALGLAFAVWTLDRLDTDRCFFRFLGHCAYIGTIAWLVVVSVYALAGWSPLYLFTIFIAAFAPSYLLVTLQEKEEA